MSRCLNIDNLASQRGNRRNILRTLNNLLDSRLFNNPAYYTSDGLFTEQSSSGAPTFRNLLTRSTRQYLLDNIKQQCISKYSPQQILYLLRHPTMIHIVDFLMGIYDITEYPMFYRYHREFGIINTFHNKNELTNAIRVYSSLQNIIGGEIVTFTIGRNTFHNTDLRQYGIVFIRGSRRLRFHLSEMYSTGAMIYRQIVYKRRTKIFNSIARKMIGIKYGYMERTLSQYM